MVPSSTVGRLHPASTPHFYTERSCYGCISSSSFFLQLSRRSFPSYGKLTCTCLRSSDLLVVSSENMPGRVDTLVDAGSKVNNVEFISDILDIGYRENNRAAPPFVPSYHPSDENGPSELDFEIYASNSMANYEPPPPSRIPFSAPFEDYYGEAVGVDYISREEKPANSLLRFFNSFNTRKGDDGGENTKKPLFTSGSLHMTDTAEGKPLFFGVDQTARC
ncbi:hypothetical protein L7F22_037587 [Adiantum nelumboides]|nr:hypothetical protein [Adiantum nelumboides]